jgi:hypothetical protein
VRGSEWLGLPGTRYGPVDYCHLIKDSVRDSYRGAFVGGGGGGGGDTLRFCSTILRYSDILHSEGTYRYCVPVCNTKQNPG